MACTLGRTTPPCTQHCNEERLPSKTPKWVLESFFNRHFGIEAFFLDWSVPEISLDYSELLNSFPTQWTDSAKSSYFHHRLFLTEYLTPSTLASFLGQKWVTTKLNFCITEVTVMRKGEGGIGRGDEHILPHFYWVEVLACKHIKPHQYAQLMKTISR